jgi:hypothetical protein
MADAAVNKVTPEEVEDAIHAVRKYWAAGSQSIKDNPKLPYTKRSEQTITVSEKEKLNKQRKLAQTYTGRDLDALFGQCRNAGYLVTVAHLTKLMTIADRQKRLAVQTQAVKSGWKRREVARRVKEIHGGSRRRAAGRKVELSSEDVVPRLREWCAQWANFKKALDEKRKTLTPTLRRRLAAADVAIAKLAESAEHHAKVQPLKPLPKLKRDRDYFGV